MNDFCYGAVLAKPEDAQFKLSDFANIAKLPTPPRIFGHGLNLVFGMLANNQVGDCVIAGGMHEEMAWGSEVGRVPPFNAQAAVDEYSAITGYVPGNPLTDAGTDMGVAAKYRRTTGLKDANGDRHKILAYLRIEPLNLDHILIAAYCLGATGVGVAITLSDEQQFSQGIPWSPVMFSPVKGMHYVPVLGRNSKGNFLIVTWGRLHAATPEWMRNRIGQAFTYISPTPFGVTGKTPEGFNLPDLVQVLASL
jgi:hypothetical protein